MTERGRTSAMGAGLAALLGPMPAPQGAPRTAMLTQLTAGPYQPRTRMDDGALAELAESIKRQGVMQPILVRPLERSAGATRFEIIAGERRFRAAKLAGLDEVPVLVKAVPDETAAVMALIENIQREDLNPLEEAQGLKRLVDEFGLTHEQAALAVGRSRSASSNLLRLLNLAPPVQQMLLAGDLTAGHARALLGLDASQQVAMASTVRVKHLSVRETERLAARAATSAPSARPARACARASPEVVRLEVRTAAWLGLPVEIRPRAGGRYQLAIAFTSSLELQRLIECVGLDPSMVALPGARPAQGQATSPSSIARTAHPASEAPPTST